MKQAMQFATACRFPTTAASALQNRLANQQMSSTGAAGSSILSRPVFLVSDLDDTLVQHTYKGAVGADAATAALKAMWERSRAAGINCKLAINTGRTLPLFEHAWQAHKSLLPQPDVLIAAVGTRCYQYDWKTGSWVEDVKWTAHMNEGWDPPTAKAVMDDLITTFGPDNVEYRPEIELHEHKLTVLYRKALREQVMPHLHNKLQQAGVQAIVIEGGAGRGPEWQFIDLLPTNAGKGRAMRYMQQQLGFDDSATVASGDANNDMLMLQEAPQSILVGNASADLKQWARQQQALRQQQHQQHGAAAAAGVPYHGMFIATEPIAAGVLQGLHTFGMLDVPLAN